LAAALLAHFFTVKMLLKILLAIIPAPQINRPAFAGSWS
jgi:hypothetical protein